VSVKVKLVPEL